MVLDLDIVLFAKNRKQFGEDKTQAVPQFKRNRVGVTPLSRSTPLDQIAKHMRYTAYKRHEQHNQQVQMLLNQRRFAQNETWRAEYDRLRGSNILNAEDQMRIDGRINDLLNQGLQIK